MSLVKYYPSIILSDPELPFNLKISRSMTVYAVKGLSQMVKCNSIYLKRQNKIVVNHEGYKITITGYDIAEKKFIYKIKKEGENES